MSKKFNDLLAYRIRIYSKDSIFKETTDCLEEGGGRVKEKVFEKVCPCPFGAFECSVSRSEATV